MINTGFGMSFLSRLQSESQIKKNKSKNVLGKNAWVFKQMNLLHV